MNHQCYQCVLELGGCTILMVGEVQTWGRNLSFATKNSWNNAHNNNKLSESLRIFWHFSIKIFLYFSICRSREKRSPGMLFPIYDDGLFFTNQHVKKYQMCDFEFFMWSHQSHNPKSKLSLKVPVAAHLRSLRSDDSPNKGHPRPIKQRLELCRYQTYFRNY